MSLSIEYYLAGSGWAECKVQFGEARCEVSASYLSDALGNLVLAAVAVLAGAHSISVGFDEEPGEYRWAIARSGNNQIDIRLLEFQELWGNRPDAEGKVLMHFAVEPLDFGEAVAAAASRVLEQYGLAGYKDKWVQHSFPSAQLDLLNEYLARWRRDR
ncbi:hypothetical protein QWZ02_19755 [Kinneretia asaccharophila]|uniref:hypothetical protein n=1 Tax=Roseateles asaccharophilus TaxID=582607 RepID=UPI00105BBA24|nr:hypothetical protein [Roseateles asaccharophilus]MDN3546691.1 hypothetical protein [Roseateles asaccharophilus]